MTTTTNTAPPITLDTGRRSGLLRFGIAFAASLGVAIILAVGALYAFDRAYEGRVLPGIRVAGVDLSGLDPAVAEDRVADAFAYVGRGAIDLTIGSETRTIGYGVFDRRVDVDAVVGDALAVGRVGSPAERLVGNAKTAVRGVALEPAVVYDPEALSAAIEAIAVTFDRAPVSASVELTETGFSVVPGVDGVRADRTAAAEAIRAVIADLDTPARIEVDLPLVVVEPTITTREALEARLAAERIAMDITLAEGDERWTIPGTTVRSWISFVSTPDGSYQPAVDTTGLGTELGEIAKLVAREPKNATFLVGDGSVVVGVTAGADGRSLDIPTTTTRINDALRARAGRAPTPVVEPALLVVAPALSTEDAEKVAPLMERISTWTTWFPIGEKNGFGANIWIPAIDIDGYVVGPGETFDFWKAVGPVTRERGYRDGGAIINGRTEPQGALAGGICSTSTTLFNAALRAGFDMGARRNHYYYIDRYPLGLDATVFKSASGSVQTMSWTNDTEYPVLIRGFKIREGSKGYVRFDLYSVPTGRTVSFSKPTVKNVRPASDSVQYTTSLAPGVRQRIEYPVDGKDVWVTRTVKDAAGAVIHEETYYSHYARITGIVLVGVAPTDTTAEPAPPPDPAPTPTP
ncbi:MAG TPA: VanW family protein [Candidatus Limnocylindrales bacterium]|nr:VanW family protein [Candidatus Limnocylindrales bacterium]